jgi:flagellar motor switch protein FliG
MTKRSQFWAALPLQAPESQIDILDWMDARSISELIIDEHPQIKALIISYLDFGLGADVLTLLPDDIQSDIVRRIATLETVEPGAIKELERVMKAKFAANTSLRASQIGGVKAAAKIMNFTKTDMEQRILNAIKKEDRDLMVEIQDNMFVFENLGGSDDRSLQTVATICGSRCIGYRHERCGAKSAR